jgi:integrase
MSAARERTRYPGIYKRGGRYVYIYRDVRGRQRSSSAATLGEAKVKRADAMAKVATGEYRSLSQVAFADYAREWIDSYTGRTAHGIRDDTREDYRKALGLDAEGNVLDSGAVPFFGRKRLAEIEPRDIRQYAAHVAARGVSRNTVRLALAPVKAMLATAVEDGLIRSNPSAGLRNVLPATEGDRAKVKALPADKLETLLGKLPDEWRLFFRLLA